MTEKPTTKWEEARRNYLTEQMLEVAQTEQMLEIAQTELDDARAAFDLQMKLEQQVADLQRKVARQQGLLKVKLKQQVADLIEKTARLQVLLDWAARIIDSANPMSFDGPPRRVKYDPMEWFRQYHEGKKDTDHA